MLKFYYNRTLAGACLDFDELANSDEFFQSVSVLFNNPAVLKCVFFYNLLNAVMPKSHLIHGICYHNNADVNQMLYAFDRKM